MGSIASNLTGGHYGYRASKAGLNAVGRSLADLARRGVTAGDDPPRLGGHGRWQRCAPLSAAASVTAMRATLARQGNHETGTYVSYDGQPLPW
ncbi:MAG: hypothetical protein U1F67_07135 [Rubrivivax sp.]